MTWHEFPFFNGQTEGIEVKIAPNGTLTSVRNLRYAKDGRWAKRFRYDAHTYLSQHSGSSAAIPTGSMLSLASLGSDRLICASDPARLYNFNEALFRVLPYDPEISSEKWLPPTFAAARKTVVQSVAEDGAVNLFCDAAVEPNTGITVFVAINRDGDIQAYVYAADGTKLFEDTLDTPAGTVRDLQCAAVGGYLVVSWVDIDASTRLRATHMATSVPPLGTFVTPVTIATIVSSPGRTALKSEAESGNPVALFGYQSAADEVTAARWDLPFTTAEAVRAVSNTTSGTLHVDVYANETDDEAWIVWVDETISTDSLKAVYCDSDLASPTSVATLSTDDTMARQPSIVKDTPGRALLAWEVEDSTDAQPGIRFCFVDTTPSFGGSTPYTYYGWHLVSHLVESPFANDLPHAYAVARPARNTDDSIPTSYYLLRVDFSQGGSVLRNTNFLHAKFGEQEALRTNQTLSHPHLTSDDLVVGLPSTPAQLGLTGSIWRMAYTGVDRCQPAQFGSGLYYSGGLMWRWDGDQPRAAGFLEPPQITGVTQGTTGSLTVNGQYSWIAVYEREEADGSVTLSTPSLPFTATLSGANDSVTVSVRPDKTHAKLHRIRIYRTEASGSVFYYAGTIDNAGGWLWPDLADYADGAADTDITENHVLYTQVGDVLGNDAPPGCRFVFRSADRLWAAGLEEPSRVRFSKRLFVGESASFPLTEEYTVSASGTVVGGGSLDSVPVIFTDKSITVVHGPGPDDSGVGLFETREVPTNSGLVAWGHRSIVECAPGLVYQANEGLMLLPRGFGPPQFIGDAVRDTLEAYPYITSALVVSDQQEVRFTAVDSLTSPTEGVMLVWDLRANVWGVSDIDIDNTPVLSAAVWGSTHTTGRALVEDVYRERLDLYHLSSHMGSQVTTADFRPGAVNRAGRCRSLQLTVEYRAACVITAEMSLDGGRTWPYTHDWDLTTGYTAGDAVNLHWHLPRQKNDRFRFRFTDSYPSAGSEGVIYLGVSLDIRTKKGGHRVRAAQRD